MSNKKRAEVELAVTGVAGLEANMRRAQSAIHLSDQSVSRLDQSLKKATSAGSNFGRVASVLGSTNLPGIGRGASVAGQGVATLFDSLESLRHAQAALGVARLPFGLMVAGAAAAAVAIAALTAKYVEMREAIKLAEEAERNRRMATADLKGRIEEELRILRNTGQISEQQELTVLAKLNPQAMSAALVALKRQLGAFGDDAVQQFRNKISLEFLTGAEKERAVVEAAYQARLKEIELLDRKQQLSADVVKTLRAEVELLHEAELAKISDAEFLTAQKTAADYRARVERERLDTLAAESAAMESIVKKAKQIAAERRLAAEAAARDEAMFRDLSIARLDNAIRDPMSPDAGRAASISQEEIMHQERLAMIGNNHLLIEQAEVLHQERLLRIEKDYADRKRAIDENRLAATADLLGASAQLARQFGRKGFMAYKATAIAQAVINTYLGASKALVDGDSYSAIFRAAAIAASGAASVAQIIAQQPGYRLGGYTGSGGSMDVAGPVHRNEYVFSAPAVRNIGLDRLDSLHKQGAAGQAPARDAKDVRVVVIDDRRKVEDLRYDPEFETVVVDMVQRNKWKMG